MTCTQDRTQASIFGRATVDGAGSFLCKIDVRDLGGSGRGRDRYRILMDSHSTELLDRLSGEGTRR